MSLLLLQSGGCNDFITVSESWHYNSLLCFRVEVVKFILLFHIGGVFKGHYNCLRRVVLKYCYCCSMYF